jgi:hypothetical protein
MPGPPEEFVALQISRLNEALLVAYSAMSGMNLKAVDRVVRIARELDRYHGFFPADRRSLPDARRPALTEAKAEEPLALLADRPGMAMQVIEIAQSAPGIAMTAACHSCGSGNPGSPYATSLSFAPLRPRAPVLPVLAGMTKGGDCDRPQTAPQAPEKAKFAPGNGMAPSSSDPQDVGSAPDPAVASLAPAQGALASDAPADRAQTAAEALVKAQSAPGIAMTAACHSRGSGNPESPYATSLSFAPLRPSTPAGTTEGGNCDRPQTAPQAPEKAQFAPANGMAPSSSDPQDVGSAPDPAVASLAPVQDAASPDAPPADRPQTAPDEPEKAARGNAANSFSEAPARGQAPAPRREGPVALAAPFASRIEITAQAPVDALRSGGSTAPERPRGLGSLVSPGIRFRPPSLRAILNRVAAL